MTEAGDRKQRATAKAKLVAQLDAVLAEACEASRTAVDAYLRQYPRKPGEPCEFGGAALLVRQPSPALREALKALNATDRWHAGGVVNWEIKTGYRTPREFSGARDLREIAKRAAEAILASKFPGEKFWVRTWVD
jgi:hypothetical protein